MRYTTFITPLIAIVLLSCSTQSDTPSKVKSVDEAKAAMTGKKWSVTDVALKPYEFENEKNTVVAYEWLSKAKEINEFMKKEQEKFLSGTLELSPDSTATTSGLGISGPQTYEITDSPGEEKQEGVRLELTGKSDEPGFDGMEITYTYYVLGADDKRLLLQTPNSLNNRPIVLLLGIK